VVDAATEAPVDAAPPPRVLPNVATEWCLGQWRGLDDATCYLVPDLDAGVGEDPDELLIYLSGIVPPGGVSEPKQHVERVLSNVVHRDKVVAMLPRGRIGLGPKDAKDWWAWPTSGADYAKYASAIIEEWNAERKKLEAALGHGFRRVYLAGSSSGAYFLALIAFAGGADFDGYAAASGGAPGPGPSPQAVKKPFYVGYGLGDPTNDHPKALVDVLKAANWPMKVSAIQTGHGAREVYLDEALAFWRAK
jgi:predicted esterase